MSLGAYLYVLLTRIFAILWSVVIGATLIGETLGQHFWQSPLTSTEMLVFGLSIPFVWLVFIATRWWVGFLGERGI